MAVVENGVVQEIIIERTAERGLVGNIYKGQRSAGAARHAGRIRRCRPGTAAFTQRLRHPFPSADKSTRSPTWCARARSVVQVVRTRSAPKGARLTTNISIPSRYMVFMPHVKNVGVSQKIEDENERNAAARGAVTEYAEAQQIDAGFIARTAAEGVSAKRCRMTCVSWSGCGSIQERIANARRQLVHEDLPLALRALRDLINPEVEKVRIDSRSTWERRSSFTTKYIPGSAQRDRVLPGRAPDLRPVRRRGRDPEGAGTQGGSLKSGGHLVIDQTEAMTTIDVNTGAFVGHRNLERPSSRPTSKAAWRSAASCGCATWAASSSSTSST